MLPFFLLTTNLSTLEPFEQTQTPFAVTFSSTIQSTGFLIFMGLVVLLLIGLGLVFLSRGFIKQLTNKRAAFGMRILLITVPKERKKEEKNYEEESIEKIRNEIGIAETLFAAVGGLRAERGIHQWLTGREDHFAFEIVAAEGLISFYIAVPKKLQQFIQQQVHAQYPDAHIQEVEDYNIFSKHGHIVGAYLTFQRRSFFPIKTYKKMESDPLNALTNSLSTVAEQDGVAIQYVVRSAHRRWRRRGLRIAREVQQGKKFEQIANRGPLRLFFTHAWSAIKSVKPKDPAKQNTEYEPYRLSPMEEEMVKGIEEKSSKAGMDVNIRVIAASNDAQMVRRYLDNTVNAFAEYNLYHYGNSFKVLVPKKQDRLIQDFIYRSFYDRRKMVLNTEEMVSLFHLPLHNTETPSIRWLQARKAHPPVNLPKEGIILGHAEYRGEDAVVRSKRADRRRHMYVIGKSGSGKTVFIQNLAIQDIRNGEGVCVIDPHGDFVEYVLSHIPKERADDVVHFNPSDIERPVGLNMLEAQSEEEKDFAVQEMISIFYKLFPPEMIGPMFEHYMRNVMLTLMADIHNPGSIAEIPRMFSDEAFAKAWVAKVTDPVVRAFWEKEMAKTSDFHKSEMLGYLISKVGRFVENEMMRNIIGQQHSGFNFREIMDTKKILLVNLAKGRTGEVNANLLGLIIVAKLQMAALARADRPEAERPDFYLYIDEFQNFITDSIATILSEARKYKLNLIIAHQYLGQLVEKQDTKIRDSVLGNAGTIVCFRIGPEDAEVLAKEFAPVFGAYDLINVEKFTAYIKLLIDNTAARSFNMLTYPAEVGNEQIASAIKELSRLKYGRDRTIVTEEILERSQLGGSASGATNDIAERSL